MSCITHSIYHEGTSDSTYIKLDALHPDIWKQNFQYPITQ